MSYRIVLETDDGHVSFFTDDIAAWAVESDVEIVGFHTDIGARTALRGQPRLAGMVGPRFGGMDRNGDPIIRQYYARRHRCAEIGGRVRKVGAVPVGTVLMVRGRKIRVEARIPREYAAVERGRLVTRRIAGGHVAEVRDLATGKTGRLSDAWLVDAVRVVTDEPDGRALRRLETVRAGARADLHAGTGGAA